MAFLLVLHFSMISIIFGGKVAKQSFDPSTNYWVSDIELSKPVTLPSTLSIYGLPSLSTIKDRLVPEQPFSLQENLSINLQGQKQYVVRLLYNGIPVQQLKVPSVDDGMADVLYDIQKSILPVKNDMSNVLVVYYRMTDDSCGSKEYAVRQEAYYAQMVKYYVPTNLNTPTELPRVNCQNMFKEQKTISNKVGVVGYDQIKEIGWNTDPIQRDPTTLTRVLAQDVRLGDEVKETSSNSFSLDTRLYFTSSSRNSRIAVTLLYNGSPLHELRVPSLDDKPNDAATVPGDLVNAILPVQPQSDQRVKVFYLMEDNSCTSMEYELKIGNEYLPDVRYYVPITKDVPAVDPQLCKKLFGSTSSIKVEKESFRHIGGDWETAFALGGPTPIPRVLARDVQTSNDVDIVSDQSFSLKPKVHVNAQGQKRLTLLVVYKDNVLYEVAVALDDNLKDVATVTGELVKSILPVKPKNDNVVKVFYWLDDGSCTWREYQYHEEYYNLVLVKYYLPSTATPTPEVPEAVCKKLFESNSVVPVEFSSGGKQGFFRKYFHFSSS